MIRVGGWERWVDTFATHFAHLGFDVTALVLDSDETSPTASRGVRMTHEHVPRNRLGRVRSTIVAGRLLRRHLSEGSFDIIYVVDSWSIPAFLCATRGRLAWRRALLAYHTFEWLDPRVHGWWRTMMERMVCRRADLVVNVDRVRGRAQQLLYGLTQPPIWSRVSLPRHFELPSRSEPIRRLLLGDNPPPDAIALVAPSMASPSRMAKELIHAVAGLGERYRFAMIAGVGPYFMECQDLVQRTGTSHRITFLPPGSFDRMMEYVVCADVGIAVHDASSTSFGDFAASPARLSMFGACGIPVVATDLPTVVADVYRFGLGVCCDVSDADSLRRSIVELAESSESPESRGSRIRRAFEEQWCFEASTAKLDAALRDLAALKASKA